MELKIFLSNENMAHPKKNTDINLTLLLPKHMNSQNNCNTSPFNLHSRHINGEVIGEVVNLSVFLVLCLLLRLNSLVLFFTWLDPSPYHGKMNTRFMLSPHCL